MLKEFVEQLKVYKEFLAIVVGLVAAALFVVNYFATKDALEDARKKLDALITQRECELSNRITIAESSASISRLEKEKLEKLLERKELFSSSIPKAPPRIQEILNQQKSAMDEKMVDLSTEIAREKKTILEARRALDRHECSGKKEAKEK